MKANVVQRLPALGERVRIQDEVQRRQRLGTGVDDAQARVARDAPRLGIQLDVEIGRGPFRRRPRDGGRRNVGRSGGAPRRKSGGQRERNRRRPRQGPGSGPRGAEMAVDAAASPVPRSSL